MSIQYLSDNKGKVVAVQLPIKEWEQIKALYPNIEDLNAPLQDWQKEILDNRLQAIAENPEKLKDIEQLFVELDNTL